MSEKKEECRGCIGFDEAHTCDEWAKFQILKKEKDRCHACAVKDNRIAELEADNERLREFLERGGIDSSSVIGSEDDGTWRDENERLLAAVNEQAEDEGLWFHAETAPEAYLQSALRYLHALIEGDQVVLAKLQEKDDE